MVNMSWSPLKKLQKKLQKKLVSFPLTQVRYLWLGYAVLWGVSASVSSVVYAGYEEGVAAQRKGDFVQAWKEIQPLAEKGDDRAQTFLGAMYARGDGTPRDPEKAIYWYLRAAEQGNPAAQYNLGLKYEEGLAVNKDPVQALSWFEKAALQGHTEAQYKAGLYYAEGKGLEGKNARPDFKRAAKWFERAAKRNHIEALNNLASLYISGEGVEQDFETAMDLYVRAAERADPLALQSLGVMWGRGMGVTRDPVLCVALTASAQLFGIEGAKKEQMACEQDLSLEDRKEAANLGRYVAHHPEQLRVVLEKAGW